MITWYVHFHLIFFFKKRYWLFCNITLLGDHERQAEVAEVRGINQWGDGNGGRGHVHSGEFQKGEQGYGEFSLKKEI